MIDTYRLNETTQKITTGIQIETKKEITTRIPIETKYKIVTNTLIEPKEQQGKETPCTKKKN